MDVFFSLLAHSLSPSTECHVDLGRVIGVSNKALFDVQMINSNQFSTTKIDERRKESQKEASRQLTQVDSSFVELHSLSLSLFVLTRPLDRSIPSLLTSQNEEEEEKKKTE